MEIQISNSELAHLIKNVPFNHVIKVGFGDGTLTTEEDSWEHKELQRLRNESAVEADAESRCGFCGEKGCKDAECEDDY